MILPHAGASTLETLAPGEVDLLIGELPRERQGRSG
jgi:hypothetical protein